MDRHQHFIWVQMYLWKYITFRCLHSRLFITIGIRWNKLLSVIFLCLDILERAKVLELRYSCWNFYIKIFYFCLFRSVVLHCPSSQFWVCLHVSILPLHPTSIAHCFSNSLLLSSSEILKLAFHPSLYHSQPSCTWCWYVSWSQNCRVPGFLWRRAQIDVN